MLCSQSDTSLASIPCTISGVKKHLRDANLLTKKKGLKSIDLSEGRDRCNVK